MWDAESCHKCWGTIQGWPGPAVLLNDPRTSKPLAPCFEDADFSEDDTESSASTPHPQPRPRSRQASGSGSQPALSRQNSTASDGNAIEAMSLVDIAMSNSIEARVRRSSLGRRPSTDSTVDNIPLGSTINPAGPPLSVSEDAFEDSALTVDEKSVLNDVRLAIGHRRLSAVSEDMVIRYVRGWPCPNKRKWVDEVTTQLSVTLDWRDDMGPSLVDKALLDREREFLCAWPSAIYGVDIQGHPVRVERLMEIDTKLLMTQFPQEQVILFTARRLEALGTLLGELSSHFHRRIYRQVFVLDLEGLKSSHLSARDMLGAVFKVLDNHYPETMHKTLLLNAPVSFRMIWGAIKPMLHEVTQKKIVVLGNKYLHKLKKHGLDPSQLPPSVGGTWTGPPTSTLGL